MNLLRVKKYLSTSHSNLRGNDKLTLTTPMERQILMGKCHSAGGFLTQPQIDQYNNEGFLILEDAISKRE